jgi:hypothetical protein
MAIAVKTKDSTKILWGEQATFGTNLASTADYNGTAPEWGEILDVELVSPDFGINIREPNRSNVGSRVKVNANYQHDLKGSSAKFVATGDAKKATLASMLYAVVQNNSEAVGTPYEKTYTFSSTQPDFTANGGWFGTLAIVHANSSEVLKIKDMICSELVLTCNPNDGQGRMQMVANLIGRGGAQFESSTESGTDVTPHARYAQTFYHFHDLKTCTVNGDAIVPLGVTIRIRNNAVPIGTNNSGDFLTYALTEYECGVQIRGHWDTLSWPYQGGATAVTALVPIVLTWGTDNNDGYLNFTIYGQPLPSPDTYDPVKGIELNFKTLNNGTDTPFTCVLADLIDRGW